jgi:hypothetical protein
MIFEIFIQCYVLMHISGVCFTVVVIGVGIFFWRSGGHFIF